MMRFDWILFAQTFARLLKALPMTLGVGVLAMLFGLAIGTVIGILRYSRIKYVDSIIRWYISFFRGTPLMIQLFIFFFGFPQLFPKLGEMGAFQASVLVMSINAGAYIAETVRSSVSSVDRLQFDAGYSIGLNYLELLRYIIIPQAFKVAIPPLGNTFIGVIQGTSLTFMLGLQDLMGTSKMIAAANYRFFETYLAVGLIYWGVTLMIGRLNARLERKFAIER